MSEVSDLESVCTASAMGDFDEIGLPALFFDDSSNESV
jgi:hypothetical protein